MIDKDGRPVLFVCPECRNRVRELINAVCHPCYEQGRELRHINAPEQSTDQEDLDRIG